MAATVVSLDLQFRDAEHLRSEYHSFANLMNVVHAELQLLERMTGPDAGLRPTIRLCEAATWSFKDRETAVEHGPALSEFRSRVQADIARVQAVPEYEKDAEEARHIIRQVIDNSDLRVQEMLARHEIDRAAEVQTGEAVRTMILAGADDVMQSGLTPDEQSADRFRISVIDEVRMPHGLPETLGRFSAEILRMDRPVAIEVTAAKPATVITVQTEPLEADLIPTQPPSSIDSSTADGTARAFIALISCLAGPGAFIAVDPDGTPLLLVQCG